MATHDYILANASGAAFRTDLNNALAAIVSNNSIHLVQVQHTPTNGGLIQQTAFLKLETLQITHG